MNENKSRSCKKIALYTIGAFVFIGVVLVSLVSFRVIPLPLEDPQIEQPTTIYFTLFGAVRFGGEWNVIALIESGVDVNAKNEFGETALHLAIKRGSANIVKDLVVNGANANIKDNNGISPLALTLKTGRENLTMLLLDNIDHALVKLDWDKELLGCLARNVSDMLADKLSENGINVHPDVKSTIVPAIQRDDAERTKVLIDNCIGNIDGDGHFTPMWTAAESCNLKVAQMLIDSGVNVNYKDKTGWGSVHTAAYNGCPSVAKMLIEYGAEVDPKVIIEYSALHIAAQMGRTEVAEVLLDNGADINLKDAVHGRTAYQWALARGHYDTANMLSRKGATGVTTQEPQTTTDEYADYIW